LTRLCIALRLWAKIAWKYGKNQMPWVPAS